MVILFKLIVKVDWLVAILAAVISLVIKAISETLVIMIIIKVLEIGVNDIKANTYLLYTATYLSLIPLLILGLIAYRSDYSLFPKSI